jgi:hypothetical protein
MMTTALLVVIVPIVATSHAAVIIVCRYLSITVRHSNMKCRTSSLNSHAHLFGMEGDDYI